MHALVVHSGQAWEPRPGKEGDKAHQHGGVTLVWSANSEA